MLLVDFGERSYKFAICKKIGQNIEVQEWGVEDMHSLEYGAESIVKQAGENSDLEPTLLSFSPAWWRAKTFYERIERKDAASRVSLAEKEKILEDLSQRVREKLGEKVQNASGILAGDIIIEKLRISKRIIDGYEVQDILGFPGEHLDFQLMVIFTLAQYRPIVDNVLKRFQSPNTFHIAEVLGEFSQAKKQDGIYLDMGDNGTQITVVQDQEVIYIDEVKRGGKDFTFFLQETLTLGENTAKDFKERYAAGEFSFLLRERVKKGFLNLAGELLLLIEKSLRKVSVSLPPSLFLFGGAAKLPEIQEIFNDSAFHGLPFSEKPDISFLLPEDLWNFSAFSGRTNPILTPLFLLPYANKENS